MNSILRKIIAKVLQLSENLTNKIKKHPPRVSLGKENEKLCLFQYLSSPLTWSKYDPRLDWHENYVQSKQIAEILVKQGYQVDVIDIKDHNFVPLKDYSLFISHGKVVKNILERLPKKCRKFLLSTGQQGAHANRQVQKRYDDLKKRTRKKLTVVLPSQYDNNLLNIFDGIIGFGNSYTRDTFKAVDKKIYIFPNYANSNVKYVKSNNKDSKHFVYIAGSSHICKGLDLLLEIFSNNPSWHLHICGRLDNDLKTVFHKELSNSNIHCYNNVNMRGNVFSRICRKSTFYISPSSSEGMQGAALNAMKAGLIPLLTKEVGVDIFGCGFIIDDVSIKGLTKQIQKCTEIDNSETKRLSKLSHDVANKHYSEKNFTKAWTNIVQEISKNIDK
jgi:hypothetical protein